MPYFYPLMMQDGIVCSMTGFGRAEKAAGDWSVLVEIKSLNGKQFEMNLKLPALLKQYEFDIRNVINTQLIRGSIDCSITLRQHGTSKPVVLNTDLIRSYYFTLQELSNELNLDTTQVLGALLKLPEVVMPVTDTVDDAGYQLVRATLQEALELVIKHRKEEGEVLANDLKVRITNISKLADLVAGWAPTRLEKIKEGLRRKIDEQVGKENFDNNRFEQELIFYIEKMDISEELVRLNNHCNYFFEIIRDNDWSKGKKIGFVLQEIGREINTTGAKAYESEMQKKVVLMKDELEKAKEQVLNIL